MKAKIYTFISNKTLYSRGSTVHELYNNLCSIVYGLDPNETKLYMGYFDIDDTYHVCICNQHNLELVIEHTKLSHNNCILWVSDNSEFSITSSDVTCIHEITIY